MYRTTMIAFPVPVVLLASNQVFFTISESIFFVVWILLGNIVR